jgi:hypothetical protein
MVFSIFLTSVSRELIDIDIKEIRTSGKQIQPKNTDETQVKIEAIDMVLAL